MAPGTPTNGTVTYCANVTANISFSNTSNGMTYRDPAPRLSMRGMARLSQSMGRLMEEAYKDILRLLNIEPTRQGIEHCLEWHRRLISHVKSLPGLQARFDRRVPCWRAGRWRSLTA